MYRPRTNGWMLYNLRGIALLLFVLALVVADGAYLCLGQPDDLGDMTFQRATGGVGLSAAVSPAWSFFAIDPRTEPYCENELWPIPGAPCYSPYHGATVADLPPLEKPPHHP